MKFSVIKNDWIFARPPYYLPQAYNNNNNNNNHRNSFLGNNVKWFSFFKLI